MFRSNSISKQNKRASKNKVDAGSFGENHAEFPALSCVFLNI